MKGIIVYNELSLQKNNFFAQKLKKELENLGAEVDIVLRLPQHSYDFAVMRVYDESISKQLDELNVRTFNNLKVSSICNDKWKTYLLLDKNSIPVAPTYMASNCDLPFPRIVKSRHGHGGSEVFWTADQNEFDQVLQKMGDSAIAQPPVGKRGRDLRVYVIGGKPVVAMLRKSDVDFRSNFSLGGSATRYNLNDKENELVCRIAGLLDLDFAGIDFLLTGDGLVCNELEDVVGCRMVYQYTDIDIIKKYAEYIVYSLKSRQNA